MLQFINGWSNQQFILWWQLLRSVVVIRSSLVNTGLWLDHRKQLRANFLATDPQSIFLPIWSRCTHTLSERDLCLEQSWGETRHGRLQLVAQNEGPLRINPLTREDKSLHSIILLISLRYNCFLPRWYLNFYAGRKMMVMFSTVIAS